jgi:di/tricarboxylate transporter
MLLFGAGIIFVVGIVVSVWVIPRVATDPVATPDSAIPSFWANVIAGVLVGVVMLTASFTSRSRARIALLWLAGVGALVLGLFLLDAAFAFASHGPSMQGVSVALFGCVGGCLVAEVLAVIGAGSTERVQEPEPLRQ